MYNKTSLISNSESTLLLWEGVIVNSFNAEPILKAVYFRRVGIVRCDSGEYSWIGMTVSGHRVLTEHNLFRLQ